MTPLKDIFCPSRRHTLLATIIALAGFSLPQKVPLEWYPLNDPGNDINYLEITCAADSTGLVQIFYDTGKGLNQDIDSIKWPISPTTQTYTYTFPLPDAPITELRFVAPGAGGAITIRQMRILDRSGTEMRRFTREMFEPDGQTASVVPLPDGWKIISKKAVAAPVLHIPLIAPILAEGINHRNFLRCLYSAGHLALMLCILLLAVLFTFYRPSSWRDAFSHLGFMVFLALIFSVVGNRGLIKNSVRYSRFVPPPVKPGARLELDLRTNQPAVAQLFWDSGKGFNENESERRAYAGHTSLQTLTFTLPSAPLKALRFDPIDGQAQLLIRGIRIVDMANRTMLSLPLTALKAGRDIERTTVQTGWLEIKTSPVSNDPILSFTPACVTQINSAIH